MTTKLLPLLLLVLCVGCDNRKCIESHTEIIHVPPKTRLTTLTGLPWMGKREDKVNLIHIKINLIEGKI